MSLTRRTILLLLKLAVGVAIVALLVRRVDVTQFTATFARARGGWIAAFAVVFYGSWAVNTVKWQALLAAQGVPMPFGRLYQLTLIGLFYGSFLPGQISGDVVRGVKLYRHQVAGSAVAMSILLDKITSLWALAALSLGGLGAVPALRQGALMWTLVGLFAAGSAVLAWVGRGRKGTEGDGRGRKGTEGTTRPSGNWATGQPGPNFPMAQFPFRNFRHFRHFRHFGGRTLLLAVGYSLAVQGLFSLTSYLAARAIGLECPFFTFLWVTAICAVAALVPVTVSGLGVREGAVQELLTCLGLATSAEALAYSLFLFGLITACLLLAGGGLELLAALRGRLLGEETKQAST